MPRELTNKVIVITGAADGIGYEIAEKYLQNGAKIVYLVDINDKLGAEASRRLNAKYGSNKTIFLECDVTANLGEVSKKIFDNHKVDVLVNNAGILDDSKVKRTIDVNVTGVLTWGLKFWEHMRKDKGGHGGTIINLASIYGYRVDQFLPTYQSSKFAVMGFTRSLGHVYNYERSGVRVVAICPGFTETDLTSKPTIWDEILKDEYNRFLSKQKWQKVEAVGDAAVEIFRRADSGSAWLIEGSKLIEVPK